MKTIEQGKDEAYLKAGNNAYFGNGFKAGVEFAQRWIPIEEEFPPINEKILVKVMYLETEDITTLSFTGDEDELFFVTHWRPINY